MVEDGVSDFAVASTVSWVIAESEIHSRSLWCNSTLNRRANVCLHAHIPPPNSFIVSHLVHGGHHTAINFEAFTVVDKRGWKTWTISGGIGEIDLPASL